MKKTGATGQNAKEGIKINLSLGKLALTVKCLAEGASHIPYRESKLTMMLSKGLGGNNMLHIILALSNSCEQVNEGTACLRFGQSCLSMTVNPNANKMEKEQAEMKAVIKEQMQEISDLQSENEALKRALEDQKNQPVPDFLVAKHIEVNKEALNDDLKEAAEQIDELRAALDEKKREKEALAAQARHICMHAVYVHMHGYIHTHACIPGRRRRATSSSTRPRWRPSRAWTRSRGPRRWRRSVAS